MRNVYWQIITVVSILAVNAEAKVSLASPFSDNMVLQREMPLPIWGRADAGERVSVTFAGKRLETQADQGGEWRVKFPPLPASKENRVLTVRGKGNTLSVKNVLVGEVWLASGQSNMEFPLWGNNPHFRDRQGAMVAQVTTRPLIRFANLSTYRWKVTPQKTPARPTRWRKETPENLKTGGLSAVAFYYALELYHALDVPVGILDAHWGGTNIDAWTPKEGLATRADLGDILAFPVSARFTNRMKKGPINVAHKQPTVLYNAMWSPVQPYANRGMIWYQGCSNAKEPGRYCSKMHALYNGFAKNFENPDFKLYFVQLAPWGFSDIALIQQAQAQFAKEQKNAGMAVINDLGNLNDIHPNEKELVSKRLALHAFKDLYGMKDIVADSPTLESYRVVNGKFILKFRDAGSWYVYNPDWSRSVGFEIAGPDGKFVQAVLENVHRNGAVSGVDLVVSAKGVKDPKHLRYLYSRPWFGALYNQVCLPLGAFHIDVK